MAHDENEGHRGRRRALAGLAGLAGLVTLACGSRAPDAPGRDGASTTAPSTGPGSTTAPRAETPPFGPEVRSLRLRRSITVRFGPDEAAKAIGTVSYDTRVAWRSAQSGPGCEAPLRWVELEPRGWVCERHLEPSAKEPGGVELPRVMLGEIVPGAYGKLIGGGARAYKTVAAALAGRGRALGGSVMIRRVAEVRAGGRTFWKTSDGELVDARALSPYVPSGFAGVTLDVEGAPTMPLGFARHAKTLGAPIDVFAGPEPRSMRLATLAPREVVSIVDETLDGWVQIAGGGWVARGDLRIARAAPRPPATAADERWVDVDLDEQTLVAWDGPRPAYATLVSTGKKRTATPEGVFRVWLKFAETDMNGQMAGEGDYAVATVPWTAFFARDLALHTSYWHDRFGEARSHGCVNLSPRDARFLYFWTRPDVPAGWSMAHGVFERPGSVIRIRSAAVPAPPFRGYARRVAEVTLGPLPPLPPDPVAEPPKQVPRDRSARAPGAVTITPTPVDSGPAPVDSGPAPVDSGPAKSAGPSLRVSGPEEPDAAPAPEPTSLPATP